jgi:hypothetical protein
MTAWGVSPAAELAALRAEQALQRALDNPSPPQQAPILDTATLIERASLQQVPAPPISPSTAPRDTVLGLLAAQEARLQPPAAWGFTEPTVVAGGGGATATLPRRADWGAIPPPPSRPVGTRPNQGVSLIPDPVFIVTQSRWPAGMEHWGLDQKVGWLQAIMHPWRNLHQPMQRLSQAVGILYEQRAQAEPNRPF